MIFIILFGLIMLLIPIGIISKSPNATKKQHTIVVLGSLAMIFPISLGLVGLTILLWVGLGVYATNIKTKGEKEFRDAIMNIKK